ncbi:MAG: hypothetical protein IPN33_14230 [Saprospiraceae bacterium]|nr:hypothetical protein [Saprospiraceae bacterium]
MGDDEGWEGREEKNTWFFAIIGFFLIFPRENAEKPMGNKKGVILLTYCNQPSAYLQNLSPEVLAIKDRLAGQAVSDYFKIEIEPIDSPVDITNRLTNYKDELVFFSYSGHAAEEEILLSGGAVHGFSMMELLAQCPNLKMVLLNGCSTALLAQKAASWVFPSSSAPIAACPDLDAKEFAIRLFEQLRDRETVRRAYDFAKPASRINNPDNADRAGRQDPQAAPAGELWDCFANEDALLDKNLFKLCYLPAQVSFANERAGVPKVFVIHNEIGRTIYKDILERAPLEDIASGSISSAFINDNAETIDQDTVAKFWNAADAICLLVSDVGFTTRFWPQITNHINELRLANPKPFFVSNINIELDYFKNFLEKIDGCQEFPNRLLWGAVHSVESLNRNNPGAGYSSLIKWLRDKLSSKVDEVHLKKQLHIFNYNRQQTDFEEHVDSDVRHHFILIEGSLTCGQEWLIKRLLGGNELNINLQQTNPLKLDFSGEEIQSAEQLWERLGATVVGKTVRAEIVQEVSNRLQRENLVIVLDRVHSAGKRRPIDANPRYPRDILAGVDDRFCSCRYAAPTGNCGRQPWVRRRGGLWEIRAHAPKAGQPQPFCLVAHPITERRLRQKYARQLAPQSQQRRFFSFRISKTNRKTRRRAA